MTLAVPADNRPTAQMILHSLHHAFGRGCGALIGGAIINNYGMITSLVSAPVGEHGACKWSSG